MNAKLGLRYTHTQTFQQQQKHFVCVSLFFYRKLRISFQLTKCAYYSKISVSFYRIQIEDFENFSIVVLERKIIMTLYFPKVNLVAFTKFAQ